MEKDELFEIWKEGNESLLSKENINKAMIEKILSTKTHKNNWSLNFNLVFYFFLQLINIALISANIAGYFSNKVLFPVLIVLQAFSVGFLLYGIYLFYKFREINKYSDNLSSLISRQLRYIKTSYEIWLLIIAFSSLVLIYNLGFLVDNDNGQYHIYHKDVFIIVSIAVFLFIYGTQKIASSLLTRTLKANLTDLRNSILEESVRLEKSRKKYKWVWIVLFLIFTLTLIAGIIKLKS